MTYDKVEWHVAADGDTPSLADAIQHVKAVMDWLADQNLLSDLGHELHALPVGRDTALTADMLSPRGKRLLDGHYVDWLETVSYTPTPDLLILDRALAADREQ